MNRYVLSLAIAMASHTATAQERYYAEVLVGKTEQESETVDTAAFAFRGGFQFSDHFAFELSYQDYGSNEFEEQLGFGSIVNPVLATGEGGSFSAPIGVDIDFSLASPIAFVPAPSEISVKNNTTAINLAVKGRYPLTETLSVIGRLGASRTTVEIDLVLPVPNIELVDGVLVFNEPTFENISVTEKGTSLYYGLGLQYEINSRFFAGLEYDLNNVEFGSADIKNETLSVSAGVKF